MEGLLSIEPTPTEISRPGGRYEVCRLASNNHCFDLSAFSTSERLPLSARMLNTRTFHCLPKLYFYNTFLVIKQVFDCLGGIDQWNMLCTNSVNH